MSHMPPFYLRIGPISTLAASCCGFYWIRYTYKRGFYKVPRKNLMSLLTSGFSRKKRFADSEECDGETETATTKLRRCGSEAEKVDESKALSW